MAVRPRKRDQGGAAAVEFALIMPIFFMLLFGIIDFGYMINRSSVINNAARDAVRVATFADASKAEVEAAAATTLGDVPGADVELGCRPAVVTEPACTFATRKSGNYATVTVKYTHKMLTPVGIFVQGGFNLDRTSEMRVE